MSDLQKQTEKNFKRVFSRLEEVETQSGNVKNGMDELKKDFDKEIDNKIYRIVMGVLGLKWTSLIIITTIVSGVVFFLNSKTEKHFTTIHSKTEKHLSEMNNKIEKNLISMLDLNFRMLQNELKRLNGVSSIQSLQKDVQMLQKDIKKLKKGGKK